MKKLLLPLLFIPFVTLAQKPSCCHLSPTEEFGQLAMKDGFAAGHEAPLPFSYNSANGELITYKCPEGPDANAFEVKSKTTSNNWLIVVHEWWGLNDYIKQEAEHLQTELGNVNVLAIDLYDGKVAETPAVAQQLMSSLKDERARAILNGAISYTGNKAKIFTIGWCMGGGWALQTSLLAGNKSGACVMYYGMPESDVSKLKKLSGDVLGIFAAKDEWINKDIVNSFSKNMSEARKTLVVKTYDADHAFANPSNPKFDKTSAGDAHRLAIEFLKKRLR